MAPGVAIALFKGSQNIHTVHFLQEISSIIKDLITKFKTKEWMQIQEKCKLILIVRISEPGI